ncbi:MAG TPA: DinB family protein [Candidatus Acidoferrales bacterium]|nr:DinB family protein [Candidatus Acidoferrales bacterium]
MNHYGGKQLAASLRTVRKNTLQIAEDIPEDKYAFRAAPDTRSVAELLTHIAVATAFQEEVHAKQKLSTFAGFDFPALMQRMAAEEKKPRTKVQIVEILRTNGEAWAAWLESLSDDFLAESVSMPPGGNPASRTRFDMLLSVKEHEMHHRGQLMLIERIIGIVPHLTRERQARAAAATNTRQ